MLLYGDYHTHTLYSRHHHGKGTVLENASVAADKGLKQIAITDHGFNHEFFGIRRKNIPSLQEDILNAKEITGVDILLGVEANIISLDGDVDVVVADGFAGNIALKASEGAILNLMKILKNEINNASLFSKIGAGMMKPVFKSLKTHFDYNKLGGSTFVGIKKIVFKTHGTCKAETILSCVNQVKDIYNSGFISKLEEAFQ